MQGDSARLAQVIVNLLDNASKYTPEGGHISLEAGVSGTTLEISVRDDGMGMPAELLPRVFDLFQQGERCSDGSGGGLGVGLTLVKSLVEMHGGQVSAESRGRGHGATFRIRLPIERAVPPEADARPASLDTRVAGSGGMPVLLVEDNAAVAASMVGLLELLGYVVRTASSGSEALRVLKDFRPRVVLLDIGLPDEDGYAVARRIRRLPIGEALLIVALTGYGHEDAVRRAAEAGFDRHLAKPVEPDELLELLARTAQKAA